MIPFFKIFSLVIRVFTRPMVNYTKKYHLGNTKNTPRLLRAYFVALGNYYNRAESWINRKFLKIETPDALFIKPLSDDVALEKGVEFFYEIMVYLILLVLPLYEMYTTHNATAKKTEQQEKRLKDIEDSIAFIKKEQEQQASRLQESFQELKSMLKNQSHSNEQVATQMGVTRQEFSKYIEQLIVQQKLNSLINPNDRSVEASQLLGQN